MNKHNLPDACTPDNGDYITPAMTRILLIVSLTATLLLATACKSKSGSREFIPGQGWVPTR